MYLVDCKRTSIIDLSKCIKIEKARIHGKGNTISYVLKAKEQNQTLDFVVYESESEEMRNKTFSMICDGLVKGKKILYL